ncbi:hypothetical protein GBZ26_19195 [Azospirillum formosense]|uniref:Uncharacterized protein n=1 Tax=Azospirillum formosense TaxID=861533 RepID=A0ABX2KXE5_9PROT|nr:hypothetical protein [Azospirillum formosense]MBY3752048.1 hypothetical protein [Azospirillum formosense]NUB21311.1 hypothetical protein [Azospirillum formosense]
MTSSQTDADPELLINAVFGAFKTKYEFYMAERRPNPIHMTLGINSPEVKKTSLRISKTVNSEIFRLKSHFSLKNILALWNFRRTKGRIFLFEALYRPLIQVECAEGADIYTHEANLNFAYILCISQIADVRTAPDLPGKLTSDIKDYQGIIGMARSPAFDTAVNLRVFQAIAALVGS